MDDGWQQIADVLRKDEGRAGIEKDSICIIYILARDVPNPETYEVIFVFLIFTKIVTHK